MHVAKDMYMLSDIQLLPVPIRCGGIGTGVVILTHRGTPPFLPLHLAGALFIRRLE